MRKFVFKAAGIITVLGLFTGTVYAQQAQQGSVSVDSSTDQGVGSEVIIPPSPDNPGFLGQSHSYSVVFRGNGEAVVSARIAFTNTTGESLNQVSLRVPKVEPRELSVYQIIVKGRCIRYGQVAPGLTSGNYNSPQCIEYSEPDYYQGYYGNSQYQKAKYELDLDTLKITLPQKVEANKQGGYFVYFRANGYTKKDLFGAFNYTFESMKTDDAIRDLRIGIATDSDLFLKGASSGVNYRFNDTAVAEFGKAAVSAPAASAAFDSYINQIGSGTIVKTASNLAPLESSTVEGAYASSRAKLYGRQIAIVGVVLVAFLVLAAFVIRFVYKRLSAGKADKEGNEKPLPSKSSNFLIVAGVSFLSSFLITAYTALLFVGSTLLISIVSYRYSTMMAIFIAIISFGVYTVLLFGPAIYFGFKKGVGWGIGMLVAIIIWLMIFMGIALLALLLFQPTGSYPGPIMPLLESSGVQVN